MGSRWPQDPTGGTQSLPAPTSCISGWGAGATSFPTPPDPQVQLRARTGLGPARDRGPACPVPAPSPPHPPPPPRLLVFNPGLREGCGELGGGGASN